MPDRYSEMPNYHYRAIDSNASVKMGKLRAESETALERVLNLRGLTLIEARSSFALPVLSGSFRRRFGDNDLLEVTYLLMLVNSSGIPILEGLNDVIAGREKSRIMPAFEALANGLKSGMSLSGVMRERHDLFPGYYSQIVGAGEISGTLDKSIKYLMSYLEWQINFKKSIRTFLRYPVIVIIFMSVLIAILFTFVFPSLGGVLSGLKIDLPLPTRILFSIASFVRAYAMIILPAGAAILIAARLIIGTAAGRQFVDLRVLQIPLVGDLIRKINLSRYFKTLATLLAAGLNVQSTFATASEVSNNTVIKQKLMRITHAITAGEEVSSSLRMTGLVQPLVISMVVIGEKTGNLDGALTRASEIYDKEVPETIKKVFAVLEPLTVVVLGVMLLIILLSIFLPMYSVVGNLHVR